LDVTPVWLAKEVPSATFPSPASGISFNEIGSTDNDEDLDVAISWLIEPRRTNAVKKYSGTNVHVQHSAKMGSILTAFAHFTYQASNEMFVLADIQSKLLHGTFHSATCPFTTSNNLAWQECKWGSL
ncbi:hypothetical protein GYMLUDRAFT_157782, partial [Collybiopsis luxurians FD-317 M1]